MHRPAARRRSYLHIPRSSGRPMTGADAIHPGYGFLSEDADFAEICADHGPHVHRAPARGDGAGGRQGIARAADARRPACRCCPGRRAGRRRRRGAQEVADEIGYPLIIKAAAGGGGRGMNVVRAARTSRGLPDHAAPTAQAVFKRRRGLPRALPGGARHIEVQLVCDHHGNGVHLGERDCSVQRRHQKLIEEAPVAALSTTPRARASASAPSRGALTRRLHGRRDHGVPASTATGTSTSWR